MQLINWFGDFQVWDSVKCSWKHDDEENFNFGWGFYCKQGLVLANCQWLHCQKAGWDSQGKCYIKRDNQRESNHQEYLLKKVRFRQLAAGLLDWLDIGFLFVRTQSRRKPRQLGTKEGVAASSLNFGARIISCLSSQHYAYDQENKLLNMLIAPNSNKTLSFCPL